MENLDDFMRQKFNGDSDPSEPRFEFREEYWEQAQALLEADEKRRRRRFFWWLFAGLLTVLVGWCVATRPGKEAGLAEIKDDIQTQREGLVLSEKMPVADSSWQEKKGIKNEAPENQSLDSQTAEQAKSLREKGAISGDAALGKHSNKAVAEGDSKPPVAPQRDNRAQQRPEASQTTNGEQVLLIAPPAQAEDSAVGTPPVEFEYAPSRMAHLALLPTLLLLLEPPTRQQPTKPVSLDSLSIDPHRVRRWQFGLVGAATRHDASPDGKRWGVTGGAFARFAFRPQWQLGVGVQYRLLQGDWAASGDPLSSSQVRYGFGYRQIKWQLGQTGSHFIELPLSVSRQLGAFCVEGGVSTGVLLGVRAVLLERRSESLQLEEKMESRRVWADTAPYRSAYWAPFLGAEWRFANRLSLGVRGHYRPGSLVKKTSDANQTNGLFWLDVGVRWRVY
ncbi:MAG: hypothetical protein KF734_00065 [Saprospiraceae bacterium]|nr:hypothetical protein [Saprospiraceae bacterium]